MIRTQVYLTKALHSQIHLVAKRAGKPAAQVIRELLQSSLQRETRQANAGRALLRLSQLRELRIRGPRDLSTKIDQYLYGE